MLGIIGVLLLAIVGCIVIAFGAVYAAQYLEARSSGNPFIHVPLLD